MRILHSNYSVLLSNVAQFECIGGTVDAKMDLHVRWSVDFTIHPGFLIKLLVLLSVALIFIGDDCEVFVYFLTNCPPLTLDYRMKVISFVHCCDD